MPLLKVHLLLHKELTVYILVFIHFIQLKHHLTVKKKTPSGLQSHADNEIVSENHNSSSLNIWKIKSALNQKQAKAHIRILQVWVGGFLNKIVSSWHQKEYSEAI